MTVALVLLAAWVVALVPILALGRAAALADRDAPRFSDRNRST